MEKVQLHSSLALLRLLQLVSPSLPVGAYAYSDGLEAAVHHGWITDEASARSWIIGRLDNQVGGLDIPILARCYRCWRRDNHQLATDWSAMLLAYRETRETRAAERALGRALARLLLELDIQLDANMVADWRDAEHTSFVALFALAAVRLTIAPSANDSSTASPMALPAVAAGYAWSLAESLVAAAIKLVPLGQSAGQRILLAAGSAIPAMVERGLSVEDHEIGTFAPAAGIASAWHETLHTRLFRS